MQQCRYENPREFQFMHDEDEILVTGMIGVMQHFKLIR